VIPAEEKEINKQQLDKQFEQPKNSHFISITGMTDKTTTKRKHTRPKRP
jgi:hypothetical protein